jgi:hypothetical protein
LHYGSYAHLLLELALAGIQFLFYQLSVPPILTHLGFSVLLSVKD